MEITLLQTAPIWKDPDANRARVEKLVRSAGPTDLIVLPEMFSTGFVTDPEGAAEEDGGSRKLLERLAAEKGCALAGSVATRAEGTFRNRFHFVRPDGSGTYYDKRHLFTYGGEHRHYTAGQQRTVTAWGGFRILLQVCYDLRFPAFSRNRPGPEGYDLILYVASWPEVRIDAWDALLKARAIENQCFVAGVNRVGSDPFNRYNGHSVVIDPYGTVIAGCVPGKEDTVTATLSPALLEEFRKKFPVLMDADRITI